MTEPTGERLQYWRGLRRMSQTALATRAGVSQSFVSKLESGERQLLRRGDLYALAEALDVSPSALTGQGESLADPLRMATHAAVPAVRRALLEPRQVAPRPLQLVDADLQRLVQARMVADFAIIGEQLPDLIDQCASGLHAARDDGERAAWQTLLVRTHRLALVLGKALGLSDLAALASALMRPMVTDLGPLQQSAEASIRSMLWTTIGMRVEALAAGRQGALLAEPLLGEPGDAGHAAAVAYAFSHCAAATASATLRRRGDVVDHLAEATRAAARIPPGTIALDMPADLASVRTWAVWAAVEIGEPDRVRRIARSVDVAYLPSERRGALWMDTARGLAEVRGEADHAAGYLRMAESAAPQRVRAYSLIRDIVSALLPQVRDSQHRDYLIGLGRRCGIAA